MLLYGAVAQTILSGCFFFFFFSLPWCSCAPWEAGIIDVFRTPYISVRVLVSNSKTNIIGPIDNSGTRFRNDWLTAFLLRILTRRDSQTVNDNHQRARLVELKPSNRPTTDRRQAGKRRVWSRSSRRLGAKVFLWRVVPRTFCISGDERGVTIGLTRTGPQGA